MKKRNCRQVIAAVLAAVMIFGTAADVFAGNGTLQSAAEERGTSGALLTGRLQTQALEMDLDEFTGNRYDAQELAGESQESSALKSSQIYSDDWDQYSTNYYYNQMSDDQREFWDALDVMCLNYLKKKTDMNYMRGDYVTDYVYTTKLSKDDATMVAYIFRYSNPQYYFLEPVTFYSITSRNVGLSIAVYEAFEDGSDRASATKEFQSAIQSWLAAVAGYATEYEKVLAIHDQICNNTVYNDGALNMFGFVDINVEQELMTQSAYSTFCMGTTVCAGYAQACELMCNALGIDAIVVTSNDHEWNKVRMDDCWYNVDCTWDDQGDATYAFFAKSDNAYNNELPMASSHQIENFWNKYLPQCTLDSGSTYYTVGSLPVITDVTAPVTINATPVYGQVKDTQKQYIKSYKVTLTSATDGATIYYTLDGSTPTVGSGKSLKYKKSFSISDAVQLSAIAVCDQKQDSAVVVDERFGAISYTIDYVLDGGKNSGDNPDTYKATDESFKLKSPTKKGYKFSGWYTDKECTSDKVTKIKKGTTGKITLYAKWTPITYSVTFDGNGADSGSMKTKDYKYGKSYKLPANKFKRAGYTFVGWNTKKNGKGTTYKNKKSIKNLTTKSGKTITLYAQWKKK
jgi:uncharacterized repeat protein (TIGR02543 family)